MNFKIKFSKRWLALLTFEFILVVVLLIASILIFSYAIDIAFFDKTSVFDSKIFTAVSKITTPAKTSVLIVISFLGKHTFLIPANILLLIYYLVKKNRHLSVRVAALSLGSLLLMFILKTSFHRNRPDMPLLQKVSGYSFPSGHSLMGVVFYGLLIYIVRHEVLDRWKKNVYTALLILLILLIGFSRIYLRVHYPSDVIAGFSVGFIWLVGSLWIIDRLEKRRLAKKLVP
jgi:membrane-associated phospholipid phosphatase